jgi:type IV fimbrial biogenesis protein FimT
MNAHRPPQLGFSLIELMFGITILAILIGLAAPSFARMTRENRVTTLTNDFVTTFAMARSESARRGVPVSICPSTDGTSCTGGTDFAVGWILFTDDFGAAGVVDGPGDAIIDVAPALPPTYTLAAISPFIRFFPNGLTTPAGNKTFQLQNTVNVDLVRCMTVSAIGRVNTIKGVCP